MIDINDFLNTRRISHVDNDVIIDNMLTNKLFGLKNLIEENLSTDTIMCEVGSYEGISSTMFAYYCKKLYCVDIFCEEAYEKNFDIHMSLFSNVEKIKNSSEYALKFFDDYSLDFVYLDAMHDYDNVLFDINNWIKKVKPKGVIGGHDYHKECSGVIKAVNEILGNPDKIYEDSSWIKKL